MLRVAMDGLGTPGRSRFEQVKLNHTLDSSNGWPRTSGGKRLAGRKGGGWGAKYAIRLVWAVHTPSEAFATVTTPLTLLVMPRGLSVSSLFLQPPTSLQSVVSAT